MKQKKLMGKEAFEAYYSDLFKERWPVLKASLFGESVYAQWNAGGTEPYFLDAGSVLAACALPLAGAEQLLDLCAAPGGKTLVIASRMDKEARLDSNERSPERKNRLVKVCDTCLPESIRSRITITCSDGAVWCKKKTDCYDRILLDAPCSSERHVLQDEKYLAQWTPSRIKTMTMAQWALLSSAWRMLKTGGFMVYATCALNPSENDRQIERLLDKFPDAETAVPAPVSVSQFTSVALPETEKTAFGYHVLPDQQGGAGPLYFSLLHKKA